MVIQSYIRHMETTGLPSTLSRNKERDTSERPSYRVILLFQTFSVFLYSDFFFLINRLHLI